MSFFLCYDVSACHYACLPASLTDYLPLYLLLRWRCGCVTIGVERYFSADAPESKRRCGGSGPLHAPCLLDWVVLSTKWAPTLWAENSGVRDLVRPSVLTTHADTIDY